MEYEQIYLLCFISIVIFIIIIYEYNYGYKRNVYKRNVYKEKVYKEKVYLFTFCVDISRHSRKDLIRALGILVSSLEKYLNKYELVVFTNFTIPYINDNIIIKKYNSVIDDFKEDKWLNLSFNKLYTYKKLYDETFIDYTWIDLDTQISYDISYINQLDSCFIQQGGDDISPNVLFTNNNKINVPKNKYIQGDFWKLNINLYYNLLDTYETIKQNNLKLRYDTQDLFNYYIHIENNIDRVYILGYNYKEHTMNGLGIWCKDYHTHATMDGLKDLYYSDGLLYSKYYPNKEIHIVSFTFMTLQKLWNTPQFIKLFH